MLNLLVGEAYWRGLVSWMRERLQGEGMIGPSDLDLLQVYDDPQQVVDAIFAFYSKRGFAPSPAEREVLLNL
jgi:predicted Rossmann-fold nucleotide-binding protein